MTENSSKGRLRPLLSGALLRSQTDARLCALASTGNQQAFSAIFERYGRELRSHAGRVVRADRADDVVQQAMLGAWSALLAGERIRDLRAWLHRVVHNAALDTITKRGYDDAELPDSSIAPTLTEELAEGRVTAGAALAAIAALPESQRRALTLTAIEGRSGRDTAVALGISGSAVRQLVHRARCVVRATVTAITPMPLITRLVEVGGASAPPAAVALGAAGGGVATAVKIMAVIGVTAATLGATRPLQGHHSPRTVRPATSQASTSIPDQHRGSAGPAPQTARGNQRFASIRRAADSQLSVETHKAAQSGGGAQHNASRGAGHQSGANDATGGTANQGSGTHHDSPATDQTATARSATNRSEHQNGQDTAATAPNQSGADRPPAPQNGQSSNGH